jgi:hypothetical protein
MAVDPNVYALSIQLQLDAQDAFTTLDKFGDSISAVEEQVSSAAEKAFQSINRVVTQIDTSLNSINASLVLFDNNSSKIAANFESASKSLGGSYDISQDSLKNFTKQYDIFEDVEDFRKKYERSLKTESDALDKHLKKFKEIENAIKVKNLAHTSENQLVSDEIKLTDQLCDNTRRNGQNVATVGRLWAATYGTLRGITNYLANIDKGTENFTEVNYRAYGSQVLLLQTTRQLSGELGVTAEVAIAAYKALADVKTPREEIDKLARTISIATRVTGISIQNLANYSRILRVAGFDADATTRSTLKLSEAMRKYGLTQSDVNRLLPQSATQMLRLKDMLGGSKEAVEGFMELNLVFAGLGKSIGFSAEEAAKFGQWLNDPKSFAILSNRTGIAIQDEKSLAKALAVSGKEFARMKQNIQSLPPLARPAARLEMERLMEVQLGSVEAGELAAATYQALEDELGEFGAELDNTVDLVGTLNKIMMDEWSESNDTLTAQLRILTAHVTSITGAVSQFVAEGLKEWLKYLNMILKPIAAAITGFMVWIEEVKKAGGPMAEFIRQAQMLSASLVAIIGVGLALSALFGLFNMFGFVGQAVVGGFQMIGQGLAALGAAVRAQIVPLIGLSFAMLLVAGAAYIFSLAVQNIASAGDEAINIVFGLVLAIVMVGTALTLLGMLAQGPVALGILAIGAAFVMVGAGIMMAGYGIRALSEGLLTISQIMGIELGAQLVGLGFAIAGFAAAIALAVPVIAAAGLAFMLMSAGLVILPAGIRALSAAMDALAQTNMIKTAMDLITTATMLATAGALLVVASTLIVSGALVLLPAAVTLLTASLILITSGAILSAGASLVLWGVRMLYEAAPLALDASMNIFTAASILVAGTTLLLASSVMMIPLGIAMLAASYSIAAGFIALGIAINRFSGSATQIAFISAGMYQLAEALNMMSYINTSSIRNAARSMLDALPDLQSFANGLSKAAADLEASTARFEDPANRLADILERLGTAISGFGEGLALADDVGRLAIMLNDYAALLEGASERISTAVESKAIPAMRAAEQAGIKEAVRSEAVTTVKMFTDREGENERASGLEELAAAQLAALNELKDAVAAIGSGDNSVNEILLMLQAYLPAMTKRDTGLSTEFNAWAK